MNEINLNTMNSIYDIADNEKMIARINALTKESKALWGKMTLTKC